MKPAVGRMVWYTNLGDADGRFPPETQAAIITGVRPHPLSSMQDGPIEQLYVVDLHVFYRTGQFDMLDVPFASEPTRGHWSWPPRAE